MEETEVFYNLARGYCDYVGAKFPAIQSLPDGAADAALYIRAGFA